MNTGTESYNRLDNPTGGGDISGQSRTANQSSLAGNGDSSKVERKRKGLADDRYGIMGQCDQLGVKGSGPFSSSDNAAKQAVSGEFSEKDSGFTKRQCTERPTIEISRAKSRIYSQRNRDKQKQRIEELTKTKLQLEAENISLRESGRNYERILQSKKAENAMLRRQASSIARNTAPESAIDLSIMSAATKASIPQNLRSIDKRLLLAERAYKQNPVLAMRGVAATSLGLGNSICLSGSQRQNIVGKPFVPVGIASMLPPPFNSNGQLAPVIPTRALPVQPRLSSRHQQPNNMSTSSNGVSSPLDSSLVASLRKRGNSIGNSSQPT